MEKDLVPQNKVEAVAEACMKQESGGKTKIEGEVIDPSDPGSYHLIRRKGI